jgi:hypothetical protein
VTLAAGDMEAAFVPSLGMLGAVLRWRGEDVLALPGGLGGYRRQHTTGLPLLAPWANRLSGRRYRAAGVTVDLDGLDLHTDAGGLPIHGTMTAQHGWEIVHLAVGHSLGPLPRLWLRILRQPSGSLAMPRSEDRWRPACRPLATARSRRVTFHLYKGEERPRTVSASSGEKSGTWS